MAVCGHERGADVATRVAQPEHNCLVAWVAIAFKAKGVINYHIGQGTGNIRPPRYQIDALELDFVDVALRPQECNGIGDGCW